MTYRKWLLAAAMVCAAGAVAAQPLPNTDHDVAQWATAFYGCRSQEPGTCARLPAAEARLHARGFCLQGDSMATSAWQHCVTPVKTETPLPRFTAKQVCILTNACIEDEQEALDVLRVYWPVVSEGTRKECLRRLERMHEQDPNVSHWPSLWLYEGYSLLNGCVQGVGRSEITAAFPAATELR